jgi:hypothetical protein
VATVISREDYVKKLRDQLEKWNSEIDALKVDAQRGKVNTELEFEKRIAQLRRNCEAANERIKQIQESDNIGWEELKEGAEEAWNGIKGLFKDIKTEFRRGIEEGKKA